MIQPILGNKITKVNNNYFNLNQNQASQVSFTSLNASKLSKNISNNLASKLNQKGSRFIEESLGSIKRVMRKLKGQDELPFSEIPIIAPAKKTPGQKFVSEVHKGTGKDNGPVMVNGFDDRANTTINHLKAAGIDTSKIDRSVDGGISSPDKTILYSKIKDLKAEGTLTDDEARKLTREVSFSGNIDNQAHNADLSEQHGRTPNVWEEHEANAHHNENSIEDDGTLAPNHHFSNVWEKHEFEANHDHNVLVDNATTDQVHHPCNIWEESEANAHQVANHETYNHEEVSYLNHSDAATDYHDHDAAVIGNEHLIDTPPTHEKSFWEELFGDDGGVDCGVDGGDDGGDFFGF